MPLLLTINLFASAIVRFVEEASPFTIFNSDADAVTACPFIANLSVTILKVPLSSTRATSSPSRCWKIKSLPSTIGFIITSLLLLVTFNTSVPLFLNLKSFPAASKTKSVAHSNVIPPAPDFISIALASVPFVLIIRISSDALFELAATVT